VRAWSVVLVLTIFDIPGFWPDFVRLVYRVRDGGIGLACCIWVLAAC